MTLYSLCEGKELSQCDSCRRYAKNNPLAETDPYQSWQQPMIRGNNCLDWMPARLENYLLDD